MDILMRKGELTGPTVMWVVSVLGILILALWFVKSSAFMGVDIASIDEDLKNVHYELSLGCQNDGLQSKVYLYTHAGEFMVNETALCLVYPFSNGNVTRCLPTPCGISTHETFDLSETQTLVVQKADGIISVQGE